MRNPIGAVSCILSGDTSREICQRARALGLDSVEWFECRQTDITEPGPAGEIAAAARDLGLHCTYHTPYEDAWNLAGLPADVVADRVEELLVRARRLGADLLTLHLGRQPADQDHRQAVERMARAIGRALAKAGDLNVRISVENLPTKGAKFYLGDCPDDFDILFGVVESPMIGWNLDIGHAHMTGNLAEFLARHGKRMINCHVHDNDGSADAHQPIGKGTIDWQDTFSRIAGVGYAGLFNLEFGDVSGEQAAAIRMIRGYGES